MGRPTRALVALAVVAGSGVATTAVAVEPRPQVVQERRYQLDHEVSAFVGVLPLDAFEKGITFSAAYTWHPSTLFGWEVAHVRYAVGVETQLKSELEALNIGPTPFETVQLYGTSSLVFKPLYGKIAVVNRRVIWMEGFATVGAGVGRLTVTTRPVVEAGLGLRVHAGERVSARMDLRDALFLAGENAQNELWLALGLSVDLGKKR